MSSELAKVTSQQERLLKLVDEVTTLKIMMREKDARISTLEQRIDELEQYTRRDDLVITGIKTRHRTYARMTANAETTEDALREELQSLEQQVVDFLNRNNINIRKEAISACHTLPSKSENSASAVVIRFICRKQSNDVLMQAKKLKRTNVYINEHLTKKNGGIAREARMLRKQKKITGTWTWNGNVWIREQDGSAKVIKTMKELEKYKTGHSQLGRTDNGEIRLDTLGHTLNNGRRY